MSTAVIHFPLGDQRVDEIVQNSAFDSRISTRLRPNGVAVSSHVASRVLFPAYVALIVEEVASSQSSTHAFDAVYRNAMDYLDKINHEDSFQ